MSHIIFFAKKNNIVTFYRCHSSLHNGCEITASLIIHDLKSKNAYKSCHFFTFLDEINMANNDDFEIIYEGGLSNEQTFELIDVNDDIEIIIKTNTPTTPDIVLPFLVSQPLVNEIPQVVQQQQTPIPTFNVPKPEEPHSPIKTTPLVQIKKTIPPPRTIAPVPPLPKAPAPRRYGDAALIPHNLNGTLDIDSVIDKSRKTQENNLNISTRQQQQQDIQIVLEQRRNLLQKK